MIFYKYTLNKMFRSVSTYVTAIFGVIPILALGIAAMFGKGFGYQLTSLVALATFPLFVVFITFKTIQVFRNEIENQTMLTIVSKPIPRKKLVFEGLLSLFTIISIVAFIGIFIPMLGYMRTESNSGEVFVKALLVTLTTILLGSIVASLGLLLSLKAKGKSFIGIMLAIFGIAFYVLWGAMTGIRVMTSRNSKLDMPNSLNVTIEQKNEDDGKWNHAPNGIAKDGKWHTYRISAVQNPWPSASGKTPVEDAQDVYNEFKDLGDFKVMDFVKWIDPTLHWQVLYNGASSVGHQSQSVFRTITSGADAAVDVKITKEDQEWTNKDNESFQITMKAKNESSIPIYYPIILWLIIGGVVIGLTFRSLNRTNIS